MSDHPVPDVMDGGGRMKRLLYALFAGIGAAAIAYFVTDAIVSRDPGPRIGEMAYSRGGYKLVYYMTALVGGAVFVIVGGVLEGIAKKQWMKEQEIAHARVLERKKAD